MMPFDLEGARKAGYSDAEIASALAARHKFDLGGAKKAGYADSEVIARLAPLDTITIPGRGTPEPPKEGPGVLDRIAGLPEAAATLVSGATAGTIAGALGGANQVGKDIVGLITQGTSYKPEQSVGEAASNAAQGLTYMPRSQTGRDILGAVGEAAQGIVPIAPVAGSLQTATAAARSSVPAVAAAGREAASTVAQAVAPVVAKAQQAVRPAIEAIRSAGVKKPTAGTQGSVGAAGTDVALQRRTDAANLDVPITLTKGQETREFGQQQFEREAAKNAKVGAPLRERFSEQNEQMLANFDVWADQTGAQAPTLREVGAAVDKALINDAKRAKADIKAAYEAADVAGETAQAVSTDAVAQVLNQSASAESVAPVLKAAKSELVRLGGASLDEAGNLVPGQLSVKDMEFLRKFLNKTTGMDPTNISYSTDVRNAIDAATAGAGGDLYRSARRLRENYAKRFEDRAVISRLLSKKPGTEDRSIAFEDVFDHSILRGSLDDVRTVRKVLQTSGPEGQQAWRELQGQTVKWLKEQATKNVRRDERGNEIVSAAGLDKAVKNLDTDGKLQFLFGKQGAQKIRDINDIAKVVYTSPPGSVNTSNTASIVTAAMDIMLSGATGVPAPVASSLRLVTGKLKDRALAKRVNDALDQAGTK